MRVDFYRLSTDPRAAAIALLARKSREAGKRLLIVAEGEALLEEISKALWESAPESFLAHGIAGSGDEADQPILLAQEVAANNKAAILLLADGQWRHPGDGFERVLYVFDDATIDGARSTWRDLAGREDIERKFWKTQAGRWVEGP
ncbi:DNA polymerase III subunit chi [Aurantiacibacter spongiae]|uniref:DNA polymerase III subunit chi n=1 Tax=Aurantiacibacter spongiae TaxID=2488860 RepID=A0A3N5D8F9_9SPHN|nr:DNA polymerase III subunit chi [Aurantiacibacter spongiae]RPF70898.1 DNA polymerase III subunit chi [Aurantiacibacter spongiae]